ncbi:MAG: hypothetical protein WC554_04285 [Clostridia bacterium]
MNREEIDLLKKHQGKIREAMGEERPDDNRLCLHFHETVSAFDCKICNEKKTKECSGSKYLVIPDTISRDPDRPERGLWGMIDWKRWVMISHDDGTVDIHNNETIFENLPPYLALLRAYDWQEGKG